MITADKKNLSGWLAERGNNFKQAPAVISTVIINNKPEAVYKDNGLEIKIISKEEQEILFLYIEDNNVDNWKNAVRTCAEAGIRKYFLVGETDNMPDDINRAWIITDHINVSGENPLVGRNDDSLGTRFPDMTGLYDRELSIYLEKCCVNAEIPVKSGVLLVPKSIKSRTDLEHRILKIQADAVISRDVFAGAIVAKHQGLRSAGLIFGNNIEENKKLRFLDCLINKL